MSEPDSQWWEALRFLVNRAIDGLESAAQADPATARAIARIFSASAASGTPDREGQAPGREESQVPAPSMMDATAASEKVAPELVERMLRLGDAGSFTIRAREESKPPAGALESPRGPRVVAMPADEEAAHPDREQSYEPGRIVRCCRLKAEACRWQSERSERLDAGEDVREADQNLISRARELSCFLWMVQPTRWRERGGRAFTVVAGCYDALADAVELMSLVDEQNQSIPEAMALLAEASSALRAAIEDYASTGRDHDQQAVFQWLDRETYLRHVYIARHMRLDDSAPPENHADLRRRIEEVRGQVASADRTRRARENLFGKISYSVKKLEEAFGGQGFEAGHPLLGSLEQAVRQLLDLGVPLSNRRLRDTLLPVLEQMPEEVDPQLGRVLAEIDNYLDLVTESSEAGADEDGAVVEPVDDDLLARVRPRLAGRHAVLVGGLPDERHRKRLEADLGLASLRWLLVKHGSSFESDAEPSLRDPSVSLVLLMTRWRSHRDGPAARRICKERRIPLVELTGGYGSRRVAHEILEQARPLPIVA